MPLVKSKSGDLTDVNNYRAIAVLLLFQNCLKMLLLKMVNLLLICTSLASKQVTRLGCVLIFWKKKQ